MDGSLDRRHMLEANLDKVRGALAESEIDDPVGFVIDATDRLGRKLIAHLVVELDGGSLEQAESDLDRHAQVYRERGQFPTCVFAADWAFAEAVLPGLAPSASESLKQSRRHRPPGQYLVVAVGGGGNTYAFIEASRPVSDGQHRVGFI